MTSKVPSEPLAAQVAHLSADMTSLDHGLIEGLTAAQALARAERIEQMLSAVVNATGLDDTDAGQTSFADPVVSA
jgi:hypothetical protein